MVPQVIKKKSHVKKGKKKEKVSFSFLTSGNKNKTATRNHSHSLLKTKIPDDIYVSGCPNRSKPIRIFLN